MQSARHVNMEPNELSCVNCTAEPDKAYLLSCLHIICDKCYQTQSEEPGVVCALCGEITTCGPNAPKDVNHPSCDCSMLNPPLVPCESLKGLMSAREMHHRLTSSKAFDCTWSGCSSQLKEANRICLDCTDFLCEQCFSNHSKQNKKFNARPHIVKATEEMAKCSLGDLYKKMHPISAYCTKLNHGEKIDCFCTKCNFLFCQVCKSEHQSQPLHQFEQISPKNTETHSQCLERSIVLLDGRIHECMQAKKEARTLRATMEECTARVLDKVDKEFALLCGVIEKRKAEVKRNLTEMMNQKTDILQDVVQTAEKQQHRLSLSKAAVDRILAVNLEPDIMSVSSPASASQESIMKNPVQTHHDRIGPTKMDFLPSNFSIVCEALQTYGHLVCGPQPLKSTLSPPKVTVTGTDVLMQLTLSLAGNNGDRWTLGGETVESFLRLAVSKFSSPPVKAKVQSSSDGTYSISFEHTYTGLCTASVLVNKVHINGSPFDVTLACKKRDVTELSSPVNFLSFPNTPSPGGLHGIAVSSNSSCIYIADSSRHTIVVFDRERKYKGSFGCRGEVAGQLRDPKGLALDHCDNLYVANCANDRIEVFKPDWKCKGWIGRGKLRCPTDVTVCDNLYVADSGNHRIAVFSLRGEFLRSVGDSSTLGWPSGLAFSPCKKLYVTDSSLNQVIVFDQQGIFLHKFGTKLNAPLDVVIAENGSLLVSNTGANQIAVFNGASGQLLRSIPISTPYGMALDGSGNLLVTDFLNKRVAIF